MDEDHLPNKDWLLDVLATLTPDDEIFRKNYLRPPKKSKLSEIESIELPASFLIDLPLSSSKVKRKGLRTTSSMEQAGEDRRPQDEAEGDRR